MLHIPNTTQQIKNKDQKLTRQQTGQNYKIIQTFKIPKPKLQNYFQNYF